MSNNRGPSPNNQTKFKLCALTGGRCYFCNKFLFTDDISLSDSNNSNLAHIIASSCDGPRGNEHSYEMSDKIENLMLMCRDHHHLIDSDVKTFTVEFLQILKQKREEQYSLFSQAKDLQKTFVVIFRSPIKGKDLPNYYIPNMVKAFLLEKIPADLDGIDIVVDKAGDYNNINYWVMANKEIEELFNNKIVRKTERFPEAHFSVFPLAPIPMIIKFGYMFSDKINNDVYQKFRDSDTWCWKSGERTNIFEIQKEEIEADGEIALTFELTAEISKERIISTTKIKTWYRLYANNKGVDCITSKTDLVDFWHKYHEVCDQIKRDNSSATTINIYCAMPVSAAFEVGRRFMKGIFPKMRIFEDNNGFFETITIGE